MQQNPKGNRGQSGQQTFQKTQGGSQGGMGVQRGTSFFQAGMGQMQRSNKQSSYTRGQGGGGPRQQSSQRQGGGDPRQQSSQRSVRFSDISLKRDVVRIGTVAEGIGLYRFQYNWSDQIYVGVLAQEVAAVRWMP